MAQIAVERRRGIPWWAWFLIALLIIGIIWMIAAAQDRAALPERTRTAEPAPLAPVTDVMTVATAANPEAFIGRQAQITNARVLSMAGPQAMWVGEGPGQQMLVVTERPAMMGAMPGEMVSITGTIREFPGAQEAQANWGVPAEMQSELQNQRVYLHADSVTPGGGTQPGMEPGTQPRETAPQY